jgi:hypothetical protein
MLDDRQPLDIYDTHAVKLLQHGYRPIPIAPFGFRRPKCPVQLNPNSMTFIELADWNALSRPIMDPQPGANIGALMGQGIVAFDYDHDDAALIISDVFPSTPVNKAGQRAFTSFYRVDFEVPSEDFHNDDGELVLQILSRGKQTILPPSIHADTGLPYKWTNGHSLYDTPIEQLRLLPRDYRERILGLGFKSGRPKREHSPEQLRTGDQGEPEGPFAELNQLALQSLDKWVPQLDIYKLHRVGRRYASYEGVAQWRTGTTGKTLEQRSLNLKISSKGIKDFGDNRGYSAIDLVMAARTCELWPAYLWLDERVRPKSNISDADLDKLIEAPDAPATEPSEKPEEPVDADMTDAEAAVLGPMWEFGDPIPPEDPMLVPMFVPARPLLGFLGGQRSTFKTFVTNDLAVAIACGGEFAGQRVACPGLVVQIELEGSLSRVRVTAAARYRGVIAERLPIWQSNKIPPPILVNRRLNPEWKKWVDTFVRVVKRKAKKLGLPLALITMDPAMYFAGVMDNNDWAQWTDVCKALIDLAQRAGCPILVVDHYGKDEDRGLIGSAAKEAAAHFVLGSGGERESRQNRQLVVRKMKDGPAYICVDFDLDTYDVTLNRKEKREDGTEVIEQQSYTTLAIKWGLEVRPMDAASARESGNHLTELQRTAMIKLITLINDEGAEIPMAHGAPRGMRGVRIGRWFERLSRGRILGDRGQGEANFKKLLTALQAKRQIEVFEPWVWVPLDPKAGPS